MNSLSEYEQVRQDNIERNEAFLRSIGMDQVQSEIKAGQAGQAESRTSKATSRGVSKRKHTVPAAPARRSSRVTIERLKSEDFSKLTQEERLKKEAELERMLKDKAAASYETAVMNNAAYGNDNEDRWTRLDDDPLSALPPVNQPSSDDYRNDDGSINAKKKEKEEQSEEYLNWGRSILTSISAASADTHTRTDSKPSLKDKSSTADYISRMRNLKCVESDVAKVAESRITSVWVHPSRERLLVAAGDKQGYLGIWDVDAPERCANEVAEVGSKRKANSTGNYDGKYDSPCGIDGVYKYRPHVGNIARIYCPTNSPSDIHSVSYDGTVRMLDLNAGVFIQRFRASEGLDEMYFTDACEWIDTNTNSSNEKNFLFVVRSDGYLSLIDFRKSTRGGVGGYAWTVDSGYKVQSVQHWPTNENYVFIANAGKGNHESSHSGQMSIYDIRMLPKSGSGVPKAVCQFSGHTKSINAAYASPDGHHIVSVSQDMTIRCWACPERGGFLKSGNKPIFSHRPHDNHTGRWLSTFRPTWDPKSPHSFISGSMSKPRCVEIFDVIPANSESSGKVARINSPLVLRSDALASVVSRNATHPTMDIIACANSSGRVHIFR